MQFQRQSFVQEQRLKMNPQLYQSLKLMELPLVDLRERIEQELERNPALEIREDKGAEPPKEEYEYFRTASNSKLRNPKQTSEEHRLFIEGALTRPETLQEHLLWQLHLEPVDEQLKNIAETLIQNLDDDGFHKENPETLFRPNLIARLQEAMELVRGLEPAGTCTADYRESLLVQIGCSPDPPPGIERALDHLELLERGKFAALSKKIDVTEEDARDIYEHLKTLSPFPGRAFAPVEIRYVIPDVRITRDGDGFIINLNDDTFPVLGINPFFEDLTGSADQAARDFAKENIKEARLFIQHLNRRSQTLIRVISAVLEFQRPFFLNGPKFLAPLTLGDIAGELKLHEATISRTANGKYVQTDWGIFEIRYFFTNSISGAGSSGSRFSKEGVKEIIREIIAAENRGLSDQDISGLLNQRGIALARRTVAKYRKELDMGTSYTRKSRK
ncbi:MAG: RNA polymerase factor sigma-54 [Treponema sp.]|nr:RNA polymerase factor sigma-54 [Treponema sp.]